jgi:RNA polymerase sigma-70 factor (ECF subfamily)
MFARGEHAASDTATYEALYDRYRARLVRYCRRRLWNRADAEDAAHETLLRAFRALPVVDLTGDPWPWLTTIAGRICTDVRRRAARPPLPPTVASNEDVVHEEVVGRLRADILEDALRQLPDHYRTSLLLREYGGWAYDDIARLQGRSVGSVRSLLARSRRRLEEQVETVARTRNQWPLPAAVPPVRRLRDQFRAWRQSFEHNPHSLVGALELSSVATRWVIGAQATLATMMTFAGAAAAAVGPLPGTPATPLTDNAPPAVTWQVRSPEVQQLVAPTAAPTPLNPEAAPGAGETLTRIDATTRVPEQYNPGLAAGGGAGIDDRRNELYVRQYQTVEVPGVGTYTITGSTNIPCDWREYTMFCAVARTGLEHAPEETPVG